MKSCHLQIEASLIYGSLKYIIWNQRFILMDVSQMRIKVVNIPLLEFTVSSNALNLKTQYMYTARNIRVEMLNL